MSVALPVFFALTTVAAFWTMWRAVSAAVPQVRELHQQMKADTTGRLVLVTLRPAFPPRELEAPRAPIAPRYELVANRGRYAAALHHPPEAAVA